MRKYAIRERTDNCRGKKVQGKAFAWTAHIITLVLYLQLLFILPPEKETSKEGAKESRGLFEALLWVPF